MTIRKERFFDSMDLCLEGRLDAHAASILEDELQMSYHGLHELHIDFQKVEYISSAGLRVLLAAQRRMQMQGRMTISNVSEQMQALLEATGLSDFFQDVVVV